ncbi:MULTISPECIES: siderophore-iron reductase FhuF [unclassified Rhizobium]|uniref:siderophore-iron reductase FhuF n=1 Tax=unclassified Rhizobium TaxID=2613769 RepID=UPI001618D7E0|nr:MULTISPECIES: siderophore-iron reductase FhuF [unclassified Rhizobium]MBB3540524.1 ferric iron reductase protein FhuF [Rhizobium sp. BK399]MCS3738466.1 ferric iron reductase protein FhuF [Rhizobium sp. BK661]MCS4091586.1 ferric iron reductase protein FhuF [Rhizobium sp. BK176]
MASAGHHIAAPGASASVLSPAFAGEHAWCSEKMALSADLPDGVPLPSFFGNGGFEQAIGRYATACGDSDRRAVVSMWSLYYFSALSIPYVLARRLAAQELPVAFDDMTIALQDNGLPRAFGVPHRGRNARNGEEDGFEAIGPLLEEHLPEAIRRLTACGVSAKLCWNNAAVYLDYVLRLTLPPEGPDLTVFVRGCLPDGGVNPLCGSLRYVEEDGERVARRKICCLRYMLPGVQSCGKLCALPSQRNMQ